MVHHWHVTLTLSGEPVEPLLARAALARLVEQRPFLDSAKVTSDTVELKFWDQGDNMVDVASLAMRLWSEHRETAGLPRWQVVGLEVVRKDIYDARLHDDHSVEHQRSAAGQHRS